MISMLRPGRFPNVVTVAMLLMLPICGCERNEAGSDSKNSAATGSASSDAKKRNTQPDAGGFHGGKLSLHIGQLTDAIREHPDQPETYFERGKTRYKLSLVNAPARQLELQMDAMADFDKAHELSGGDRLVDPNTKQVLSLKELAQRKTDGEGRLLELPDVRKDGLKYFRRLAPNDREIRVGGPGMAKALVEASVLLLNQYRFDDAMSYAERAERTDPDDFSVRVLLPYTRGIVQNEWAASLRRLTKLAGTEEGGKSAFAWVALARCRHHVGHLEEAEAAYRRVLEIAPSNRVARNNLALLLSKLGRQEEAQEFLRGNLEANQGDLFAANNLGISLTRDGKPREAIVVLKKVLNIAPGFPAARINLGVAYSNAGETDLAIDTFRKVIALVPSFHGPYMNLAYELRVAKRHEEAAETYKAAIRLAPDFALAHNSAGLNYLDMREYEKAAAAFRLFAKMVPSDVRGWGNLGLALVAMGRDSEAELVYQKALLIEPKNTRVLNEMGLLSQKQGKPDDAIRYYVMACESDPREREPLWNLNRVALQYGRIDRLIEELGKIIDRGEMLDDTRFFRAQAYNLAGRYDDAIRDCEYGLDLGTPDWQTGFHNMRGISHMLKGDGSEAETDFRRSVELDGASRYPALWIWITRMRSGNGKAALATVKLAHDQADPESFEFHLLQYYMSELDADSLLKAAQNDDQRCEAYYYIGEKNTVEGKLGDATLWFQKSIDTRRADNYEYVLAQCRLNAMEGSVATKD